MKCPVCKTECETSSVCPTCAFSEVGREFLNQEEAELWTKTTVFDYRANYEAIIKDFVIEGTRLVKYNGTKSYVKIPPGVVTIGCEAFSFNRKLMFVSMPNTVTTIEAEAFDYCKQLNHVFFSNCLEYIGDSAFRGCENLQCVLPASVRSIGSNAFSRKDSLDFLAVNFMSPFFHIEKGCLIERESKTLIIGCNQSIIPDDGSVIHIKDEAFLGCDFKHIELPDSIRSIGDRAFAFCRNLSLIEIPASVWSIGRGVFEYSHKVFVRVNPDNRRFSIQFGCLIDNYESLLLCGNGANSIPIVETIGRSAFSGCAQFTSIEIPFGVKCIEEGAFWLCPNLCEIEIPFTVTQIRRSAFVLTHTQSSIDVSCDFCQAPSTWDRGWFWIEEDYTGKCDTFPDVTFHWGCFAAPVNRLLLSSNEDVLVGLSSLEYTEELYIEDAKSFRSYLSLEFIVNNGTDRDVRVWMKDFEIGHDETEIPYSSIAHVMATSTGTYRVEFDFEPFNRKDPPYIAFSIVIDLGNKTHVESDPICVFLSHNAAPIDCVSFDGSEKFHDCPCFPNTQTDLGEIPF